VRFFVAEFILSQACPERSRRVEGLLRRTSLRITPTQY
jgi:hypothetical protein